MTIRVMIVDDSAVMRRLLAMALRPATDIEVVAMAANGLEALAMIDEVHPDLVTLDVEMPEMDGLATMQAIHDAHPELAVIMCSGLTEQHAVTTINALRAGAVDHITKPVASSSDEALQTVHDQLVPKIRVLANRHHRPRRTAATPTPEPVADEVVAPDPAPVTFEPAETTAPVARLELPRDRAAKVAGADSRRSAKATTESSRPKNEPRRGAGAGQRGRALDPMPEKRAAGAPKASVGDAVALRPWPTTMPTIDVIAIGVSTGGPVVLERVVESLPEHFPVPIVVVQHMPAVFTKILAERLDTKTSLRVREVTGGELLTRGTVWLAPGGLHLKVRRMSSGVTLVLDNGKPELSCKPAVDVLFRSVASAYGSHALAAVLTGMGRDGTRGTEAIVKAGGLAIAQDEATSTVWGMPGSVASVGLVNALVPLDDLAACIEGVVARHPWAPLVASSI